MNPIIANSQAYIVNTLSGELLKLAGRSTTRQRILATAQTNGYQNQFWQQLVQYTNTIANNNCNRGMEPNMAINDACALVAMCSLATFIALYPNEAYSYTQQEQIDAQTCNMALQQALTGQVAQPQAQPMMHNPYAAPVMGQSAVFGQPVANTTGSLFGQPVYPNMPVEQNTVHYTGVQRGAGVEQNAATNPAQLYTAPVQPTQPAQAPAVTPVEQPTVQDLLSTTREEAEKQAQEVVTEISRAEWHEMVRGNHNLGRQPIVDATRYEVRRRRRTIPKTSETKVEAEVTPIMDYKDHQFGNLHFNDQFHENRMLANETADEPDSAEIIVDILDEMCDSNNIRVEVVKSESKRVVNGYNDLLESEREAVRHSEVSIDSVELDKNVLYAFEVDAQMQIVQAVVPAEDDQLRVLANLFNSASSWTDVKRTIENIRNLRTKYSLQLLHAVDRFYTERFNQMMRFRLGLNDFTIDSFVADYEDALVYVKDTLGAFYLRIITKSFRPEYDRLSVMDDKLLKAVYGEELDTSKLLYLTTPTKAYYLRDLSFMEFECNYMTVGEYGELGNETSPRLTALANEILENTDEALLLLESGEIFSLAKCEHYSTDLLYRIR